MTDKSEEVLREGFPPCEFLKEEMDARGWSKETLAVKSLLGVANIEALLANKRTVNRFIAKGLSDAFDTGMDYWLNLQKLFDEWKERESQNRFGKSK